MSEAELKQVEIWLNQDCLEQARLGVMAVRLLSALAEAETPEEASPPLRLAHQFLDLTERELTRGLEWPDGDLAKLFSTLLTILAEAGQYRHEGYVGDPARRKVIDEQLLPPLAELRERTVAVAKQFLRQPLFASLTEDIETEILPLLESMGDTSGENSPLARDRYMPFRVIQAGNIAERLYGFRLRTGDSRLVGGRDRPGLLQEMYERKYIRFGTSGVRGRWGVDFTEASARRVAQAICDFLKAENVPAYAGAEDLAGKRIVIGYDSRKNARTVSEWVAQVCLANGFTVDLASRDLPTPALVYYLTDYLPPDEVAGLINCTASHNPPEWQGIKFNPRQGFPAPTNTTDYIAARVNQLQLLDQQAAVADLAEAEARGLLREFDPIVHYTQWVLESGKGNARIPIDVERIRRYFADKLVIIDEMYGASRGYLPRLLGEIGVRHRVIHAERDPTLPGLDYANPEEPFNQALKDAVRESGAVLGLGMDTDADRFGVVDQGGVYFRPNQVLPMLLRYLGVDRGLTGRVIATQTGSPLLERLAALIPGNDENKPEHDVVPAYVGHPFYHRRVGEREDRVFEHTFMVPVGIKYIEEQRRTDRRYRTLKELPPNWRDTILIGGEESSGLTTRGHVTDKDGIWANLLIMDMVAYYGKSVAEIWEETTQVAGLKTYGGLEHEGSNTGRRDVDAVLEAKEALINDFLDRFEGKVAGEATFEGLQVIYAGGIRYDYVELQLRDAQGGTEHHLRLRASGTEPINRIYVESSDPEIARKLMEAGLKRLEELSAAEIRAAHSEWRLAEILSATRCSPELVQVVRETVAAHAGWSCEGVVARLERMLPAVEKRVQGVIRTWIEGLCQT